MIDSLVGDPRLNAVASLKRQMFVPLMARDHRVIHGLMPWPH